MEQLPWSNFKNSSIEYAYMKPTMKKISFERTVDIFLNYHTHTHTTHTPTSTKTHALSMQSYNYISFSDMTFIDLLAHL